MSISIKTGVSVSRSVAKSPTGDGYGENIIVNGSLASGANWTIDSSGWSIADGVAYALSSFTNLRNSAVVELDTYLVEFDCVSVSGARFFPQQDSSVRVANGKYSREVTFAADTTFRIQCDGSPAGGDYIDNVSVRKKL